MKSQAVPPRGIKYFSLVSLVFALVLTIMVIMSHVPTEHRMSALFNQVFLARTDPRLFDNTTHPDVSPSCADCRKDLWTDSEFRYVFGDYEFPEPNCDGKLLVYECVTWLCGGLGDREKGIMSAFVLAMLTNRTFVIDHRKPCDIKKFLEPNVYDWSKCLPHVIPARTKGHYIINYIDGGGNLPKVFTGLKPGDIWTQNVVTIHVNINMLKRIKGHPSSPRMLPWLLSTPTPDVVTGLMHALFKTEISLENHLQQFIGEHTGNGSRQFVTVHIRTGFLNIARDIPVVFKFLEQYSDKNKYSLYVASDKLEIRNQAMQRFKNFASVNREIVHIDQFNKPCEGVYTAVFEQQILSRGDILVMTPSGFSRVAAFIRGTSDNMFLLKIADSNPHFESVKLDSLFQVL